MERDRKELLRFVDALENHVFRPLLSRHRALVGPSLRQHANAAWQEVKGTLDEVRHWLGATASEARAAVDSTLASFGLTGAQLAANSRALSGHFRSLWVVPYNAIVKWYKAVLEWANLILGSLSRAYPPVDVVKEYKEFLELSIDYRGTAAQQP